MKNNLRKFLIITLLSVMAVCASVLFVGCNNITQQTDSKSSTVYFYIDDELVSSKIFTLNQTLKLPTDNTKRAGYFVDGWFLDKGVWKEAFSAERLNACINDGVEKINVYAKVTPIEYNISYENTKGANLDKMPKKYTVESQMALPEISAEYYVFNGWLLNGKKVEAIEKGNTGDAVYTASFTPTEYEISYVDTKGAENSNPISYNIESKEIVLKPLEKDGYNFEGWLLNGEKVTSIPANSNGNRELTATWSLVTYTISYENAKGADVNSFATSYNIESENIKIPDIQVDYYNFNGWYVDGEKVEEIPTGSYGNITLTASFTPIQYTITYSGTNLAQNLNPIGYTVESGEIVLKPLKKEGYNFEGWLLDDKKVTSIPANSHGNKLLEATWSLVTYTITYENTKTADISSFPKTFTIESQEIVLPENVEVLCHTFIGWKADGKEITKIPTGTIGNIVLKADYTIEHKVVDDLGKAATCTQKGLTDGTHCSVCGDILVVQKEIPALGHKFVTKWTWDGYEAALVDIQCLNDSRHNVTLDAEIYTRETPPTCQLEGVKTYVATVSYEGKDYSDEKPVTLEKIPHKIVAGTSDKTHNCEACKQEFNHSDLDYNGYCDECKFFIEEIIQLNTAQDILEIANNMEASYVLKSDITLSGSWPGLGSTTNPFKGKLYGNGHTISGLTYSVTPNPGGLFVSNQGLIDGLTLKDLSISMYSSNPVGNASFVFAGIAAYNHGTIKNCKITGTTTINTTNDYSLEDSSTNYTFTGGAITAENHGTIDGCVVEGTVNSLLRATCYSYHNGIPGISMVSRVTSTVYYGNVAGVNEGTISNTMVTCSHNVSLQGKATCAYPVDDSYVTINCYVGSLVGVNKASLSHCSAKAYVKTESVTQNPSDDCYVYLNVKNAPQYEGIVAENSGKIEKFYNH